ncbi:MAG: nucleotidyltransferase domain-containing protein [Acidobacteriota bacterium]|nr:nucleotidyltransferase domain-containing protein [Acidobacteriota bacterium]
MDALPQEITQHLDAVRALCEKYSVKRLAIFGSAVKGTFDPATSDVDFVVEFLPGTPRGGFDDPSLSLTVDLETLFGRRVDVVERRNIENPYFRQVLDLTERTVYESARAA